MLAALHTTPVRRVLGTRRGRRTTLLAVLLAGVAPTACSESAASTEPALGAAPGGTSANTPASLLGSWIHGVFSPTDFYNASTGQYIGNAYGTAVMFKFTPDGKYEQTVFINSTVYSCRTQVFVYNKGVVRFDGGEFRVYPTSGRVRSSDSCNARFNFDRDDDIARKQGDKYTWAFERNAGDGKTYLMIGVGDAQERSSFWQTQ